MTETTCVACGCSLSTASATMTVEGMLCSPCNITKSVDAVSNRPAGSMPGKLQVVFVLMIIAVVLSVLTSSFISAGIGMALLLGLFVGNDGVRKFVIGLVWLDLMIKAGLVVFVVIVSSGKVDMFFILITLVSVSISGFVIWVLGQHDVRDWMFRTAFKEGL